MRDFQLWTHQPTLVSPKHGSTETPAALLDHDEPNHGGAFMWLHISIWPLMCVHRPRKRADYESADSPHFLPSDLLEGLCWADWWTAVGVWLSSERLAGDNLSALSMVASLKTALFGFTLRWKDPPVILLFRVVPTDLPLSPQYRDTGHNYVTP